ncbi:MAG: LytTR family DNA-binding domain-containing protein [Bacteroidales bacterium]|nr:LytTR family DNA-binding domain-containing protein [Bacteroidales bacterium]
MITCVAIDDEPLALRQLERYIKKTPFLQLVSSFSSASDAAELLLKQPVDLMYTDINMPDITGLDFVKSLQNKPLVVFSTAYEEYAVESFKIDAIDYLLKPYGYDAFLKSAMKARQYLEWMRGDNKNTASQPQMADFIFLRADNQSVKVPFQSILYVEAMSEYIRVHFKDGRSIMTFMSVKLMADSLPKDRFMRIHRSYIIALDAIDNLRRQEVVLSDGTLLPVSNTYKDDLQHYVDNATLLRKNNDRG